MRKKLSDFAEENFLQTDFNVLLRLNERGKSVAELTSETLYPRDTVNTILKRLLDLEKVFRDKVKNGKYVYSTSIKIDINDEQYAILDHLMDYYKNIMTPNACRIICVLLDDEKFSIQDLILRGWKSSALYKNTTKLEENKIIVRDGLYFKLSPEILEAASNGNINKKISIVTHNFGDYYRDEQEKEERIEKLKKLTKAKSIIAIQDFKAGVKLKWVKKFEDNYEVIKPQKFNDEYDFNKMITMLLVNKKIYKSYESLYLDKNDIYSLRYTYGLLTLKSGRMIRILNLYIPQSYNITDERKKDIKDFWEIIIKEVRRCRKINDEFIVMGDLNAFDGIEAENRDSYSRLSDIMIDVFEDAIKDKPDWGYTWVHKERKINRRLDYIFVNSNVIYNNTIECIVDDRSLNNISDHKIIQIDLKSNLDFH